MSRYNISTNYFVVYFLIRFPNTILKIILKISKSFPEVHCLVSSILSSKRQRKKIYNKTSDALNNGSMKQKCIVFIDNCYGGITDCFKSIVSLYEFCLKNNLKFKIYKNSPFDFSEYFQPSKYNWNVSDSEFRIMLDSNVLHVWLSNDPMYKENTWRYQQDTLLYLLNSNQFEYIFVYYSAPHKLSSKSFNELFKPTLKLQNVINDFKDKINNEYISASFRFVNLLSDSNELVDGYDVLPVDDSKKLINANICVLKKLINNNPYKSYLVTSDSYKFITAVENSNIKNVYFIKGEEIHHHIAFSDIVSDKEITKSYVEFMLISEASTAFQIQIGPMYESKFPKWAACVNNVPYYLIRLGSIYDVDKEINPMIISYN